MTQSDLVSLILDVSIDPCDSSMAPSLQYVLIRGFSAMGWEQPKAASEDMAMEILKMIRPSSKPHPMDEGIRSTQKTMTIAWLRDLATKGGRGVVNNIDARCLGRIADEIERLTALNNRLTEDFNTLALDRSKWQERAEKAEAVIKAAQPAVDDDEPLSARDLAMIDQAWENHKAALPVATVINDNQPGRTAIIEITIDPPTLPVGTKLYAGPKMIDRLDVKAEAKSQEPAVASTRSNATNGDELADRIERAAKDAPEGEGIVFDLYPEDQATVIAALRVAKSQEPDAVTVQEWKWKQPVKTVADLVNNLMTIDQTMDVHAAYFITYDDGRKEARTRSPSLSRERVANSRINNGDEAVPYSLVIWTSQDERPTTNPEAPAVNVDAIARIIDPVTFAKCDAEIQKDRKAQNGRRWADVCYGDAAGER